MQAWGLRSLETLQDELESSLGSNSRLHSSSSSLGSAEPGSAVPVSAGGSGSGRIVSSYVVVSTGISSRSS